MGAELVPIVNIRSSSGQHHSELRDNSFSTFWSDTRQDAWIELDFGSVRKYNLLQLVFGEGLTRNYHFSVWREDAPDSMSERIFDGHSKKTSQLASYDLKESESQFLRIVIHENNSEQPTKAQIAYIEVLHESITKDLEPAKEAVVASGPRLNALVTGPNKVDAGSTIILDATGSTGNIRNYTFKQKDENEPIRNLTKLNPEGSKVSFIAPNTPGELKIKLIVTDNENKKDRDYHIIK